MARSELMVMAVVYTVMPFLVFGVGLMAIVIALAGIVSVALIKLLEPPKGKNAGI